MARRIFRKKKKRNPARLAVVAVCLAVAVLVTVLVVRTLGRQGGNTPEGEETVQTTTTTETRKTLPKSFIDRNTYSPYVVLYDETADQVLYSKNADEKCYPASLTKLATALVALDYTKPDDVFTLGSEVSMISPGSSQIWEPPIEAARSEQVTGSCHPIRPASSASITSRRVITLVTEAMGSFTWASCSYNTCPVP